MQPIGWLKLPNLSLWNKIRGGSEENAVTEAKKKRVLVMRESIMYSVGVQIRGKEGEESIIGSSYRKKRKLREGVGSRTFF